MSPPDTKAPGRGETGRQESEQIGGVLGPNYSNPAASLLDRLDAVRETGAGRWIARCPAHDDRSPSLSVRETDDGTVLIRCHAGCGAADVVAAVALELRDLFPDRGDHRQRAMRARDRSVPRDALKCLASEAFVALLAAEDVAAGKALSEADRDRLAVAVERLRRGAREAGCNV